MNTTIKESMRRSMTRLLMAAAITATLSACADRSMLAPTDGASFGTSFSTSPSGGAARTIDLTGCEHLAAPAGTKPSYHTYAKGVQIYRWSGSAWTLVAPSATLYADAKGRAQVGTHYAGPTWKSNSGSTVVGAVMDRCTPDPRTIPWLLLRAVVSDGPGVFKGTTHIQRVNTEGGLAPSTPGTVVGQEVQVPYRTEYFFYRAN